MLKPLILAAAIGTLAAAAPAYADGRHGHGYGHGHFKHHRHFKHYGPYHRRPVVVMPPPRVYYAPPPVVHYPAPAYPASGVSIRLHFPL